MRLEITVGFVTPLSLAYTDVQDRRHILVFHPANLERSDVTIARIKALMARRDLWLPWRLICVKSSLSPFFNVILYFVIVSAPAAGIQQEQIYHTILRLILA